MKPAGRLRQKRAEGVRHNMPLYVGAAEGRSQRPAQVRDHDRAHRAESLVQARRSNILPVVRIAISHAAFDAIAKTLPLGSVG